MRKPRTKCREALECAALHVLALLVLLTFFGEASALAAEPAWAIPDAPLRATFRANDPPTIPEAGWLLQLPELGATTANSGDVVLMDAKGAQLPLAKVARMEGHRVLLLAKQLTKGQDVYVYYGGNRARRDERWSPKVSLLMETRRFAPGTKMDDAAGLEFAYKSSKGLDGAGFVTSISHGENPFGENSNFFTHYSGWLKLPEKKATLYTISSDASFVQANDKVVVGWPGKHSAQTNQNTVPRGDVSASDGLVKIDYWHAKEGAGATMVLGWIKAGKLEPIPPAAWVQPGSTEFRGVEHVAGWPVPQPSARVASYIGYEGQWLFETECALKNVPAGWQARWEWSDGAVFTGPECSRVCVGQAPVRVTVRLTNGQQVSTGAKQIEFNGLPAAASIENDQDVARYMALIAKEDPAKLSGSTLSGHLVLVNEFGTDELVGRYGTAWVAKNNQSQGDPLWLAAQLARIRALAQTNPAAAIGEMHKFDLSTRKKFPALSMLELDILVFGQKSPEAIQLAQRIGFENPNTDLARIAKIRVGDLYRLLGRVKEARALYESVQKTVADATGGNKLPAMDRAFSITIHGLMDQGERQAAEAKLVEWETDHPLAKYESDFLLLRGQVLMLFGRWNEALQEIESFRALQGDNPFQILADFYRAKALFELGKKDDAKKIWADLAKNYPKHELAGEAARLSK